MRLRSAAFAQPAGCPFGCLGLWACSQLVTRIPVLRLLCPCGSGRAIAGRGLPVCIPRIQHATLRGDSAHPTFVQDGGEVQLTVLAGNTCLYVQWPRTARPLCLPLLGIRPSRTASTSDVLASGWRVQRAVPVRPVMQLQCCWSSPNCRCEECGMAPMETAPAIDQVARQEGTSQVYNEQMNGYRMNAWGPVLL